LFSLALFFGRSLLIVPFVATPQRQTASLSRNDQQHAGANRMTSIKHARLRATFVPFNLS
jgi:hypothetical protein